MTDNNGVYRYAPLDGGKRAEEERWLCEHHGHHHHNDCEYFGDF